MPYLNDEGDSIYLVGEIESFCCRFIGDEDVNSSRGTSGNRLIAQSPLYEVDPGSSR